jgi:predicted dehydrogenase
MKQRVAVIGAGAWGQNIVNTLAKLDALAAVVDPTPAVREKFKALYPNIKTLEAPTAELWADSEITAVAIATPVPTHFEVATAALKSGKHVFVEKPMVSNLRDAESLAKLSREVKRTLMTGHLLLYQPAVTFIKSALEKGLIGQLYSLHQERLGLGRVRNSENVFWSLGVHDIAVLLHLCGSSPTEISFHGQPALNPKIEDDTYLHMKFAGGVQAHLHNSWLWPDRRRRLVAVGSLGMLVYEEIEQKVFLHKKTVDAKLQNQDAGVECVYEGAAEPLKLELQHFLACNESGDEPLSGPTTALEVMRVLEKASPSK